MGRFLLTPYVIFSASFSLLCGFLRALPFSGGLPSPEALASAARGLTHDVGGSDSASYGIGDTLNAWLWQTGGASLLLRGQWFTVFLESTLITGLLLVLIGFLARFLGLRTRRILIAATVVLIFFTNLPSLATYLENRKKRLTSLSLLAPIDLVQAVQNLEPEKVFANDEARAALRLFASDKARQLAPTDPMLAQNPKAWRTALREKKWQLVLLTGPMTSYRPLLDHLVTSPDWHLAAISNQGFLFERGQGPSIPSSDPEEVLLADDRETALHLAQLASRLDAIHRLPEARAAMDRALALAPQDSNVQSHAASLSAAHKQWHQATTHATAALAAEPKAAQPRIVRALAELEAGEFQGARNDIKQVLRKNPDDPYSLFLLARICKAMNDTVTEADTLEHLIALTIRAGQPVVHYRIYLGQAYARLGRSEKALTAYQAVLEEGRLNPEQTIAIQEAIDVIKANGSSEK
jgi:predicted negative regulator of RcsB-dependent stress response